MSVPVQYLLVPVVALFVGCSAGIQGSGVSKTEMRTVDDFHAISSGIVGEVTVAVGEAQSVSVTIDDNLIEFVTTEVVDGELQLNMKESYRSDLGLKIAITVPAVDSLKTTGVGDLTATGIESDNLSITVSGVGDIKAAGKAKNLTVRLSGVGDADLGELQSESAVVKVSGVGSATVFASEAIDASASGVGDVLVLGQPKDRKVDTSGVGSVNFPEE